MRAAGYGAAATSWRAHIAEEVHVLCGQGYRSGPSVCAADSIGIHESRELCSYAYMVVDGGVCAADVLGAYKSGGVVYVSIKHTTVRKQLCTMRLSFYAEAFHLRPDTHLTHQTIHVNASLVAKPFSRTIHV